jgi:hypothetical protein
MAPGEIANSKLKNRGPKHPDERAGPGRTSGLPRAGREKTSNFHA